jgi:hypothetical protein
MKSRFHPIAIALAGWYLMLPPATGQNGMPQLMVNAPIALWTIAESFDSSKTCERELDVRRTHFEQIYKKTKHTNVGEEFWSGFYMAAANSAACVATDDPRLRPASPHDAESDRPPPEKPTLNADGSQL